MHFSAFNLGMPRPGLPSKLLLIVRIIIIIMTACFMQVSAASFGQKITLSEKNASLEEVLNKIRLQSGMKILYADKLFEKTAGVSIHVADMEVSDVLNRLFAGQPISFDVVENTIVIKAKTRGLLDQVMGYFNQININGHVRDDNGRALAGATIKIKNGSQTAITDANGAYSLRGIDEHASLIISFMGFKTQEVGVNKRTTINITLVTDMSNLEDVVVVGYGTSKRKDLVGSIATVNGEDLRKQSATNFTQGLVGRAPGVQVSRPNGTPGASASIRIRGMSTLMGVSDPLFVIDGIVVQVFNGGGPESRQSTAGLLDPLAGIDVNDIENVEILKDATAAAIYGSRASNGVIIVTTKKGKAGVKPVFSFNYDVTADRQYKFHDVLSAPEYIKFITDLYAANKEKIPAKNFPGIGNTDWQREIVQTGLIHNLNLSLMGATKDGGTTYGFSSGLTDQQGIIINTGFKRYSLRANVESKVLDFFKIGTNVNYSSSTQTGGSTAIYMINMVPSYRVDIPVFNPDGSYANNEATDNPVAARQVTMVNESKRMMATVFGELEIIPGLKARSAISYDLNTNVGFSYRPSWLLSEKDRRQKGSRSDRVFEYVNRVFDNTVSFTKSVNKHNFDAVAGVSWMLNKNKSTSISSINFPNDEVLNNLGSAGTISSYGSGGDSHGLESYFVRSNYNYDGKYYLSLSGRADNSTKFGPDSQWGYFPSLGLAWRFSKEKFMDKLNFIDDAKLRLTIGKTGSSAFGGFGFLTLFNTGYIYNEVNGIRPSRDSGMPNPDIHWESTLQTDVALELSFLKSRLKTNFNYYRKYTEGLITSPGIPVSTGYSYQVRNIGDISNTGLEITLSGIPIAGRDFSWISDFNISFNKNRIAKTYGTAMYGNRKLQEGEPLNGIRGYRTNGLYQEQAEIDNLNAQARLRTGNPTAFYQLAQTGPGDVRYVDVNQDGVITADDMSTLGYSQNPDYYGGWNNSFRYKNFEISTLFQFDVGSEVLRESNFDTFWGFGRNVSHLVLDAWTPENRNTNQPRNTIRYQAQNTEPKTDRFIEDASFLRLKSVQLSYVFKAGALRKIHVQQLRLFVGMTNLLTWTKYKGLDPEVDSINSFADHGRDTGVYPQARSMTFGVNLKF